MHSGARAQTWGGVAATSPVDRCAALLLAPPHALFLHALHQIRSHNSGSMQANCRRHHLRRGCTAVRRSRSCSHARCSCVSGAPAAGGAARNAAPGPGAGASSISPPRAPAGAAAVAPSGLVAAPSASSCACCRCCSSSSCEPGPGAKQTKPIKRPEGERAAAAAAASKHQASRQAGGQASRRASASRCLWARYCLQPRHVK